MFLIPFCSRWVKMWTSQTISDDHFSLRYTAEDEALVLSQTIKIWFPLSAQLSVSARLCDRRCFLMVNVSFSRLRSLSKERGGHPRRSCPGVAARRGNPGQEGRNQGRRANERVSGETLSLSVSLFSTLLFSVFSLSTSGCLYLFLSVLYPLCLCVCHCLCLPVLAVTQPPAALTTSSWYQRLRCSQSVFFCSHSIHVFLQNNNLVFSHNNFVNNLVFFRTLQGTSLPRFTHRVTCGWCSAQPCRGR